MSPQDYRPDCLHFRGHVPCRPHKERGVHCRDCPEHVRRARRLAAGNHLRGQEATVGLPVLDGQPGAIGQALASSQVG